MVRKNLKDELMNYFSFLIASFFAIGVGFAQDQETRTWKSASGKFAVEATMLVDANDKLNDDRIKFPTGECYCI